MVYVDRKKTKEFTPDELEAMQILGVDFLWVHHGDFGFAIEPFEAPHNLREFQFPAEHYPEFLGDMVFIAVEPLDVDANFCQIVRRDGVDEYERLAIYYREPADEHCVDAAAKLSGTLGLPICWPAEDYEGNPVIRCRRVVS